MISFSNTSAIVNILFLEENINKTIIETEPKMLALHQTISGFDNLKCGEVFYKTPSKFNIVCSECSSNVLLEKFPLHFMQHLVEISTLEEDTINLEEVEKKKQNELSKSDALCEDKNPIEEIIIECALPKLEINSNDAEDEDEDNTMLSQLINKRRKTKKLESSPRRIRTKTKKAAENEKTLQDKKRARSSKVAAAETQDIPTVEDFKQENHSDEDMDWTMDEEVAENEQYHNQNAISKEKEKLVSPDRKYECNICDRVYANASNFKRHNKIVHKISEIDEENVPIQETNTFTRESPVKQEDDGNKNSVEINEIELKSENEEFVEVCSDQDKDWTLDEKCNENDEEQVDNDNENDQLPFPCLICNKMYRKKVSLDRHNNAVHNENPSKTPRRRRPAKTVHKCEQCDITFRSARELNSHISRHGGLTCDICNKTFSQFGNMVRHKIRHTGIKDFKCPECPKDFYTKKDLKAHSLVHTGLLPYVCEVCGKRCRDHAFLKAHMRRHTGERPAKCEVCGKCFYDGYDLNVHAVTHTNERPFVCDICGSTFQRKKALRLHKRIHDKDRKYECKICGKAFAQSGGLNAHIRKTHNTAGDKDPGVQATTISYESNQIISILIAE